MRRIFVLSLLMLLFAAITNGYGQKLRPYNIPLSDGIQFHFGYAISYTYGNYAIEPNNPEVTAQVTGAVYGFELQLLANKRLHKNLSFRGLPGIGFVSRDIEVINIMSGYNELFQFQSIYIGCPLLLKYKSDRLNNFSPYIIAGANPRFDLAAGIKKPGRFGWDRALADFNQYVELGTGIDFYLPTARIGLEIKYSVGLLNDKRNAINESLIKGTLGQYNEYIKKMTPSILVVTLIIEQ
jgi:hypothetical protein